MGLHLTMVYRVDAELELGGFHSLQVPYICSGHDTCSGQHSSLSLSTGCWAVFFGLANLFF